MKIFIDAGHNYKGADTGANANGLFEQNVTFLIADELKNLLIKSGHSVKMSRNKITDCVGSTLSYSLKARCDLSNSWSADLFISIHANAGGGRGSETYVYSENSSALPIAKNVQKAIVKRLNTADRGVKYNSGLYVLSKTKAPAILIETAFIDNKEDAKKLKNNTKDFAKAIFEGVTGSSDITEINDILWELEEREIITDEALWKEKLTCDKNVYWLTKKTVAYLKKRGV
ncbi:MAG: N-acetylmuramoyl-L-alanine amidase [Clostridia bacterium]|nr:N-acetylmuramoyl-L-alanine amidase [Clostridia bacterium]